MKIGKLCRLPLAGMAVLLILSGCGRQQTVEAPELLSAEARQEAVDLGTLSSLTSAEKKAYSNTANLDRNLSPAMERQVRYHFMKYSRERRGSMENFLRNSIPYLNYTKSVFRMRGLPEDLAYLAYLESGYNPLAVSPSNAVGMWQFISSTGKAYGLRQDWWVDERRDPYRSTEAAATYLARLYDIFHDWHLAVASYNGGEGKIGRAKQATGARSLHEIIQKNNTLDDKLQLREETALYVPRFLAISKIMRNAETLGIKPSAPDADHPVLVPVSEVTAKSATDLAELARRLGMGWKEFQAYNPHFLRSISPAGRTSVVYVPKNKEALARQLLKGTLSGAGWRYYKVVRGDTLAKVSSRTGVPASIIGQLNPGKLKIGQQLRIPQNGRSIPDVIPAAPVRNTMIASSSKSKTIDHASSAVAELRSARSVPSTYKVKSGDTLSAIARRYGVDLDDIYAANGGTSKLSTLRVGQVIRLSAPATAVAQKSTKSAVKSSGRSLASHTVKSGETAYAISRRYGISFDELCAVNGGKDALNRLSPGQVLKIPSGGTAVAQSSKSSAKSSSAAAASRSTAQVAEYSVQSGETLWSISRKFNMKPMELLALNGMDQSTRVKVGDTVKVIRNN